MFHSCGGESKSRPCHFSICHPSINNDLIVIGVIWSLYTLNLFSLWLWTEEDQILHREQLRQVQDEHANSTQAQTRTRPVLLTTAPTCHLRCCVVKHLKYLDFNILMRALLLIIVIQWSLSQTMVADLYCTSKNSVTRNTFKWCNSYRNLQKKKPYRKQQQ